MDEGGAENIPGWAAQLQDDLRKEISEDSTTRRRALLGQEHRLVSAVVALVQTVRHKRWDDLQATIGALVWCLLPSAGTASIGIIAIATLVVAVQQARYQGLQAEQAAIQNQLADVQRRVGLMQLVPRLLDQIEEHEAKPNKQECGAGINSDCWLGNSSLYRPSQAVSSQIATLTAGLRPYRAVIDSEARIFCPSDLPAEPILVLGGILGSIASKNIATRTLEIPRNELERYTKQVYDPANSKQVQAFSHGSGASSKTPSVSNSITRPVSVVVNSVLSAAKFSPHWLI